MRLALFSDIHGNPIALETVLKAINGEVDGYIVIGDHLALGYDPVTTLQMLQSLPNAVFTHQAVALRFIVLNTTMKQCGRHSAKVAIAFWTISYISGKKIAPGKISGRHHDNLPACLFIISQQEPVEALANVQQR